MGTYYEFVYFKKNTGIPFIAVVYFFNVLNVEKQYCHKYLKCTKFSLYTLVLVFNFILMQLIK